MSQDIRVGIHLDKSSARQQADAFRADMRQTNAGLAADAKAAADAETALYRRASEAKKQAAAGAAEAQVREIRRVDQEEDRSYRLRDQRGRFLKRGSEEYARAVAGLGGALARTGADGASSFAELGAKAQFFGSTLGSVTQTAMGIGAVVGLARSITGAIAGANAEAEKQLEKLRQVKDLIREVTMMTGGKEGPSDAEVQKHIATRTASGLTQDEATQFALEFHGAGEMAKGTNISETEFKRLEPQLARFAATAGGGADGAATYGKLGGLLLGLRKFDKAEDVVAAETQFNRILSLGVGDNPTLIKQAAKVAGAYVSGDGKGVMKDERELAAVTAVASRINPQEAGEIMKSTTRVLRGFGEQWKELLQDPDVRITEKDSYTEASKKLFTHLEKVEKSGRSVDAYLAERGVDQHGATNLMAMYRSRAMLDKIQADESTPMSAADATREVDEKYRKDITLQTKVEQAKLDAARLHNAMPLQYAKKLQLEAETSLEKQGMGVSNAAAALEDQGVGRDATLYGMALPPGMSTEEFGRKVRVEQEMHRQALKRGLKVPGRPDEGPQKGKLGAEYAAWIISGADVAAYSAVGSTMEQQDRVGGGAPNLGPGGRPLPPGSVRPAPTPVRMRADTPEAAATPGALGGLGAAFDLGTTNRLLGEIASQGAKKPPKDPPRPLLGAPPVARR